MNKATKISLAVLAIVAVILTAWYIMQSTKQAAEFNIPNPALQERVTQKDPSTSSVPLPPLPADNKQAIDSEIQGIDQSLQATDAALSIDTTDASLGL